MHRPLLIGLLLAAALATPGIFAPPRALAEASDGEPFNRRSAAGVGDDQTEFLGSVYIQRFAVKGDRLVAVGALSGRITRIVGAVAQPVRMLRDAPVTVPVTALSASCAAMDLQFGPFRPDPLGPLIRADPIHLSETSEADDLSRNLRCSLADLLEDGAPPRGVAVLLNSVLKLLA